MTMPESLPARPSQESLRKQAKKLARDMDVEVEFHPVEFPYLISDLLADRYDIIVAGFSIVADRALQVNFSAPYYNTDVTLAANVKTAGGKSRNKLFCVVPVG